MHLSIMSSHLCEALVKNSVRFRLYSFVTLSAKFSEIPPLSMYLIKPSWNHVTKSRVPLKPLIGRLAFRRMLGAARQ